MRWTLPLESLKGRVVLLTFWVFTCSNCTNTLPSLRALDTRVICRSRARIHCVSVSLRVTSARWSS